MLECLIEALDDEIREVRRRGESRTVRFRSGVHLRSRQGSHVYRLHLARRDEVVEATSVMVLADGVTQTGELLDFQDGAAVVAVPRRLGQAFASGVIEIDPSAILVATRSLIGEIASGEAANFDAAAVERLLGVAAPVPGLAGGAAPGPAGSVSTLAETTLTALDVYQQAAVERALDESPTFTWGPPGTGKTRTLGHLAAELARRGRHVLLVAHAHVAVDAGVLAALAAGCTRVHRIGTPQLIEIPDRVVTQRLPAEVVSRDAPDRDASGAEPPARAGTVTAATLSRLVTGGFLKEAVFDHVIVDEASMAMMPHVVLAAGCASRCSIFGDVRQLPPVVQSASRPAREWLGRDVFAVAGITEAIERGRADPRLSVLRRQYRAHPAIAAATNAYAYGGMLESAPSTASHDRLTGASPIPGAAVVLWDTASLAPAMARPATSRCNAMAAVLAATAAAAGAAEAGALTGGERLVGVATPYVEQARLIRALVEDLGWADQVEVATVHRFQGGERELIVVDLCDANPMRPPPFLERDEGLRLLNVAISRARSKLVVIADSSWLRHGPTGRAVAVTARSGATVDAAGWDRVAWFDVATFLTEAARDIDAARERVLVRAPRLRGSEITTAVEAAARKGAQAETVTDSHADTTLLNRLEKAGVNVVVKPAMADRLIVADAAVYAGNTTSAAARSGRAMVRVSGPELGRRLWLGLTGLPPRVRSRR